jgi:hypothetical protein
LPRKACKGGKESGCANTRRQPDSILFLLFSLTFIAAVLYLPHHISILSGRAWYYINGEHIDVGESARKVASSVFHETLTTGTAGLSDSMKEL